MYRIFFSLCFTFNQLASAQITVYNEPNTIGSHLMRYFIVGLKHSLKGEKIPPIEYEKMKNSSELNAFYKALPKFIELTSQETEILKKLPKSVWSLVYTWYPLFFCEFGENSYKDYHKVVRSVSQRIIQKALSDIGYKINVEYPVIHYRLGDVPFCRQRGHHLNRYSYYLWALERISSAGIDTSTVIIVTSNKHHSNEKITIASDLYLLDFILFLNESGYKTIVQSESVLYDFATLVFSPAVISASSSFSFTAGLSTTGIFLCPKLGTEAKKAFFSFDNCDWMYSKRPILHCEVKDYFDVENVIKKFRKN